MIFPAARSRGGLIGLAALGVTCALELAAVASIVATAIGPRTAVLGLLALLLLPVIGRLAFWVWGYYRLSYEITRDGLVIHWAGMRQIVPMQTITRLTSGKTYVGGLEGIRWPGYQIGHTRVHSADDRIVETLVYVTAPPEDQLIVFTSSGVAYAISPSDRAAFVEEFKVRRRLGPVQNLSQETVQSAFIRREIWTDRNLLRMAVIAVAVNALLFAITAWQYPVLPAELPIRFQFDPEQARSIPTMLRPRSGVWTLPLIGLGALVLNSSLAFLIHSRARLGAALLIVGVLVLQLAIGLALVRVL